MTIQYKSTKHAKKFEGDSLTEQEHKDSCDINIMFRKMQNGQQINGGPQPVYGYDDVNMDRVRINIDKQNIEQQFASELQESEFTEEQLKAIPDSLKKKFQGNIKLRKAEKDVTKNAKTNEPNEQKSEKTDVTKQPTQN